MSTQSLDSDIYDYGFILNSTALHEAAMSVLVTTIYGRWRGTTTFFIFKCGILSKFGLCTQCINSNKNGILYIQDEMMSHNLTFENPAQAGHMCCQFRSVGFPKLFTYSGNTFIRQIIGTNHVTVLQEMAF